MRSLIVLTALVLSFQIQAQEIVSRSVDKLNNIFIVSKVEVPRTEGMRSALGLGEGDILLFDEGDDAGLIMSCNSNSITYFTSNNSNIADNEIEFDSREMCREVENILLNTNVSIENHIKFIFNFSAKKLEKVSVP